MFSFQAMLREHAEVQGDGKNDLLVETGEVHRSSLSEPLIGSTSWLFLHAVYLSKRLECMNESGYWGFIFSRQTGEQEKMESRPRLHPSARSTW